MKLSLFISLLFMVEIFSAQTFVEKPPFTPFADLASSSIAFADVNGDSDLDVLMSGRNAFAKPLSKLYLNDGSGIFIEMRGTPFAGVTEGSIAFADIDGDNDQDVLITGLDTLDVPFSKLYTNDGLGNFTEIAIAVFDGVSFSSIAFADVDRDNDQDVILTGLNDSDVPLSKLYLNDGFGSFAELIGVPFEGVSNGSVAFADVEGDGDQDVLLTGLNGSGDRISKLYNNDGTGNFSEVMGDPFAGLSEGSIAFADIDFDNDQDVLLTGLIGPNFSVSKLYKNDGLGNFTEVTDTPFTGVFASSIAFADVDGDDDQDIVLTGTRSLLNPLSKLYLNDGSGIFSESIGTPFEGVAYSSIAFADVDGDNDEDMLLTGLLQSYSSFSKLYINDGSGMFAETTGSPFERISYGSVAFADVDGDNDADLLITGKNNTNVRVAELYINGGGGVFTEMMHTPFDGVSSGSTAFADVDGDNDVDLLITGSTNFSGQIAKLYLNDGLGNFEELIGTPFDGVGNSSIAFADVDGDNDQDVLITGRDNSGVRLSKLYINDGLGNFEGSAVTPFDAVYNGSIAFADIDGDDDQDVFITGNKFFNDEIAKLYLNDGLGNFSEVMGSPFKDVYNSSIAFADIDGDSDQDLLLTGTSISSGEVAKLYINDGLGNFSEVMGTPFDAIANSSIAFADIDGDNDQDALLTGYSNSDLAIAKLYTNDGVGNFTELTGTPFEGVSSSSIAFSDVDGDNDQDVFITGSNGFFLNANLYINEGVSSIGGFSNAELSHKLLAYPNPTKANQLNINYDSPVSGDLMLSIYDFKGSLVSQRQESTPVGPQTLTVDISGLPSGTYVVQLDNGKGVGSAKFVVE